MSTRCPKGIDFCYLACCTKGLILADARCPKMNNVEVKIYYRDGGYLGGHTKLFGSMEWKWDDDMEEGG